MDGVWLTKENRNSEINMRGFFWRALYKFKNRLSRIDD